MIIVLIGCEDSNGEIEKKIQDNAFIPFKYVHPFRVVEFRKITLMITSIWMITTTILLFDLSFSNPIFTSANFIIWLITNVYFAGTIVFRSIK